MERDQKRLKLIRRMLHLCMACLKNYAYHSATYEKREFFKKNEFLITINNNFLDMFVLDWCKLFGDKNGRHYYGKGVQDSKFFLNIMLGDIGVEKSDFENLVNEMKHYRDKSVAHLDQQDIIYIPNNLAIVKNSTIYLYDYLKSEIENENLMSMLFMGSKYYKNHLLVGKREILKLNISR